MGKLGQVLVARGWITVQQLTRALQNQQGVGGRLGTCLLETDAINEDILLKGLAEQLGVPAALPEELRGIAEEVIALLPEKLARRCRAVPFRVTGGRLDVAMQDPRNLSAQDEIAFASGKRVKVFVAPEVRMYEALERYYGDECPSRLGLLLDRLNRARFLWKRPAEPEKPTAPILSSIDLQFAAAPLLAPPPLPEPLLPPSPERAMREARPTSSYPLPPLAQVELRRPSRADRADEPSPRPIRHDDRPTPPPATAAPAATFAPTPPAAPAATAAPPPRPVEAAPVEHPPVTLITPLSELVESVSEISGEFPLSARTATPPPAAAAAAAAKPPASPPPSAPPAPAAAAAKPAPARPLLSLTAEEKADLGVPAGSGRPLPSFASDEELEQALLATADREEIGRLLLGFLRRHYQRAALFQVHRDRVSAWMADGAGLDREVFHRFSVDFRQPSIFLNLQQGSGMHLGPLPPMPVHRELSLAFGGGLPRDAAVLPVRIKDRLVAVIYGEGVLAGQNIDLEPLRRLAKEASSALERAILSRKRGAVKP